MQPIHTEIRAGAEAPFRVLHITDTHLTYADMRDGERKVRLAESRSQVFGEKPGDPARYLALDLDYAKRENIPVLHTGDLIDFVSLANLEYARDALKGHDVFMATGNHEFSLYVGEAWEDIPYRMQSFDLVQSYMPTDLDYAARVICGVNFVALDNGYYRFSKDQLRFFREEAERGLPMIVMLHNPLHTDELYRHIMDVRKADNAALTGTPEAMLACYNDYRYRQQKPDADTLAFIDALYAEPLVKALITGHLHFSFETKLPNGITQYVTGGEYDGISREITVL